MQWFRRSKFSSTNSVLDCLVHRSLCSYRHVQFHENAVTMGAKIPGCTADSFAKNRQVLISQMTRYQKLSVLATNPLGHDKTGLSGKVNGEEDDVAMAFQMLVYYPTLFFTKAIYAADRVQAAAPAA